MQHTIWLITIGLRKCAERPSSAARHEAMSHCATRYESPLKYDFRHVDRVCCSALFGLSFVVDDVLMGQVGGVVHEGASLAPLQQLLVLNLAHSDSRLLE